MAERSSSPSVKPPAACRTMSELRAEIDRLDRQLVALLADRAGYVARAAEVKQERAAIVDEARIEQVIVKVRARAISEGADPDLIEAIYRAMIAAFIAFEERAFERDKKN